MDLWLLGRRQELAALHGHPAAFAQLNALERCLVTAAAGSTRQLAADMAARCCHALRDRCTATVTLLPPHQQREVGLGEKVDALLESTRGHMQIPSSA